jgi:transcriptional regulator GlxA family with amidase domain
VDGSTSARSAADAIIVLGPFVGRGAASFLEWFDAQQPELKPLLVALHRQHERGALIASVCSGAFMLAESGLLDGRRATTHWALADAFRQRYPQVDLCANEVITEQKQLLCSGAVTSYLNLALRLVERFAGRSLASTCSKLLLIDMNRISQASYRELTVQDMQSHSDRLVERAQHWMEKHVHEGFRLSDLANHLTVSERTVIRRFKTAIGETPLGYLQAMRIDIAKRLLETSNLNVELIGERVGYGDLSTFRRLFKRETGVAPREYQQRFSSRKRPRTKLNDYRKQS